MLQRVLATHPDVASASETWLLLPLLYSVRDRGIYAEYVHRAAARAVREFSSGMPGGELEFRNEIAAMVLRLYSRWCTRGESFFVDKTPRYHLVAAEILEMFPEAKFVFLWRNPLSVIASISRTWYGGSWRLYSTKVDLFDGVRSLVDAYEAAGDRAVAVRYEDLVSEGQREWRRLFDYIGIDFREECLEDFGSAELQGSMGDRSGLSKYSSIDPASVESWTTTVDNPVRQAWCRRYLMWVGQDRLRVMGYEVERLLDDMRRSRTTLRRIPGDLMHLLLGLGYHWIEPVILRDKLKLLPDLVKIHAHR
jgi:hypothetical protein